jgi:hypothetical protein
VRPGNPGDGGRSGSGLPPSRGGQHASRPAAPCHELPGVVVNGQAQPAGWRRQLLVSLTPRCPVGGRWTRASRASLARLSVTRRVEDGRSRGRTCDVVVYAPGQAGCLARRTHLSAPTVLSGALLLVTALVALALSRVPHSPLRHSAPGCPRRWWLTRSRSPSARVSLLWLLRLLGLARSAVARQGPPVVGLRLCSWRWWVTSRGLALVRALRGRAARSAAASPNADSPATRLDALEACAGPRYRVSRCVAPAPEGRLRSRSSYYPWHAGLVVWLRLACWRWSGYGWQGRIVDLAWGCGVPGRLRSRSSPAPPPVSSLASDG